MFSFQKGAKTVPHWNCHLWGSGFSGYNESRTLRKNLEENFKFNFDVIFGYYAFFHGYNERYDELKGVSNALTVYIIHEWRRNEAQMWKIFGGNILFTTYLTNLLIIEKEVFFALKLRKDLKFLAVLEITRMNYFLVNQ